MFVASGHPFEGLNRAWINGANFVGSFLRWNLFMCDAPTVTAGSMAAVLTKSGV